MKDTGQSNPTARTPPENPPRPYMDEAIEGESELLEQVEAFEKEIETQAFDMKEYCDKVDSFIAGGHYGLNKDELDSVTGETFGEWPTIPHTWEIIDKQTAALTRHQTRPKVIAEDAADFAMLPEGHPFKQIVEQNASILKRKTDNEIFAEIMSARLETACERGRYDEVFEDVALMAAQYKKAYVLVRFQEGDEQEGAKIEPLDACDVDEDPRAPRAMPHLGRFIRYRIRRTCKWVKDNLGYEPTRENTDTESYSFSGEESKKYSDYSYNDEKVMPDDRLVDVWVWFIKDETMVEKTIEIEESEMVLGPGGVPLQDPITGEPIQRLIKVTETVTVPKWRGGWKMFFKVQKAIRKLQDNPNPMGVPPIFKFEWIRNPRKDAPISIYDLDKDANQAIDRAFKYAIESSNRARTKIVMKRSAITNPEEVQENEEHGIVWVDEDTPLGDSMQIVQAQPMSAASLELASAYMAVQDKALGAVDIREPGGGASRVTGDAVEGMMGPDADRHEKRLRRWLWFKRDVYKAVMFHILEYEDLERTVVLGRDWGQPTYISFDRSVFDFSDWEFEARWDIVMREPDDLPMNRAKRNSAKLEISNMILSLPPNRAKMALRFLNLEDEAALKVMLDEEIEQLSQQPPPPTEIEVMQAKADIEVTKEREILIMKARLRASEGISDSLERIAEMLAERGNVQQSLLVLQLMPKAVEEAMMGTPIEQNQAYNQALSVQSTAIPAAPTMPGGVTAGPM